jgi:ribonucleoside-diphosphate reductase alpha chain
MAGGHYETAKAFILYREARRKERAVKSVIGVEDDLGLSINQLKVIERRYLLHDEDGKVIETPREWLTRVAKTLARWRRIRRGGRRSFLK